MVFLQQKLEFIRFVGSSLDNVPDYGKEKRSANAIESTEDHIASDAGLAYLMVSVNYSTKTDTI